MKVFFSSDHAGFQLKASLMSFVKSLGHDVVDCGAPSLNDGDDFADYVIPMAKKVAAEKESVGIALGASGQGEGMAANRIKGVRAAVYYGEAFGSQTDAMGNILNLIQSARSHNDANVLALGARFLSDAAAKDAVKLFLDTPFSGDERHSRRIAKIDA